MLKIRRPLGRLIFNMGIAIPGKTVFLIETAPRYLRYLCDGNTMVKIRQSCHTWPNVELFWCWRWNIWALVIKYHACWCTVPVHQQAWYWLCRADNMYCWCRVNLIYLCQAKSKIQFKMWIYRLQSLKQFSMLRVNQHYDTVPSISSWIKSSWLVQ